MAKILIIQAARFGDLIQTKRLAFSLAQRGTLHILVDTNLEQLARILYPFATIQSLSFHGQLSADKLIQNKAVFAALQEQKYDQIYNCNFSPLTSAICRLFAPELIRGYRPAHNTQGGLLRSPWARIGFRLSAMRESTSLNLVDFWGYFAENPIEPELVNPPAMPGGEGLGIALAGREERRSLPLDALAAAAQTSFRYYRPRKIFLFGTEAESARARKLTRLFDGPMLKATVNLCGKTGWTELVERMTGLDLLLTPDTGLMHLAAHLGVPTLCFFLSSAWYHETGPYGLGHRIFQASPACAPCLEAAPCAQHLRCHHIFQRTDFTRCVGEALDRILPLPWPDGLQLWQTGLDNLGANPLLMRGYDRMAETRQALRQIVKTWLGVNVPRPDEKYESLQNRLIPPTEWMLPPYRYS